MAGEWMQPPRRVTASWFRGQAATANPKLFQGCNEIVSQQGWPMVGTVSRRRELHTAVGRRDGATAVLVRCEHGARLTTCRAYCCGNVHAGSTAMTMVVLTNMRRASTSRGVRRSRGQVQRVEAKNPRPEHLAAVEDVSACLGERFGWRQPEEASLDAGKNLEALPAPTTR